MSEASSSTGELLSPALKKVIMLLMQKMEKNLREHFTEQLKVVISEVNVLKVKVTELERAQRKADRMIIASMTPTTASIAPSLRLGDITARKLTKSPEKDEDSSPGLGKRKTVSETTGSSDIRSGAHKEHIIAGGTKAITSVRSTAVATSPLSRPTLGKSASERTKAVSRSPREKSPRSKSPRVEPKDDEKADDAQLSSPKLSHEKSEEEEEEVEVDQVPESTEGEEEDVVPTLETAVELPAMTSEEAPEVIAAVSAVTLDLLATELTLSDDDSGDGGMTPGGTKKKRRKRKSPSMRKQKSYKVKRKSFAHVSEIFIGNRYALIDGRWGICKYYDPKNDMMGIELEMGTGDSSSEYLGKKRWKLPTDGKACFVSRKMVESDCGPT
jgi:hypothetical protein